MFFIVCKYLKIKQNLVYCHLIVKFISKQTLMIINGEHSNMPAYSVSVFPVIFIIIMFVLILGIIISHRSCFFFLICCVCCFVCLFGLMLNVPVNSYGHIGMFSSPNHIFSWASLTKGLLPVNQYFTHILSLVADNKPSLISGREGKQP